MLHTIRRLSNKYGGATQKATLTMARAVTVSTLTYGALAYELNKTRTKALQVLRRATLRTISGLPRHVSIQKLEQAVPLLPIEDIINEAKAQAEFKRPLTHQGHALIAWDMRTTPTACTFPIPLDHGDVRQWNQLHTASQLSATMPHSANDPSDAFRRIDGKMKLTSTQTLA